jgi:hypothetical protein
MSPRRSLLLPSGPSCSKMDRGAKQRAALWVVAFLATVVAASLFLGCNDTKASSRNTGKEKRTSPHSDLSVKEAEGVALLGAVMVNGFWGPISDTGSMEPLLGSNALTVFKPYTGTLEKGMIVSYKHPLFNQNILHKVVAVNATHFIPQGIANPHSDGWQPRSSIEGVLIAIVYHER